MEGGGCCKKGNGSVVGATRTWKKIRRGWVYFIPRFWKSPSQCLRISKWIWGSLDQSESIWMVQNGQKWWIGVVGRETSIQWVAPMSYFIEKSKSCMRNRSDGGKEQKYNLEWAQIQVETDNEVWKRQNMEKLVKSNCGWVLCLAQVGMSVDLAESKVLPV